MHCKSGRNLSLGGRTVNEIGPSASRSAARARQRRRTEPVPSEPPGQTGPPVAARSVIGRSVQPGPAGVGEPSRLRGSDADRARFVREPSLESPGQAVNRACSIGQPLSDEPLHRGRVLPAVLGSFWAGGLPRHQTGTAGRRSRTIYRRRTWSASAALDARHALTLQRLHRTALESAASATIPRRVRHSDPTTGVVAGGLALISTRHGMPSIADGGCPSTELCSGLAEPSAAGRLSHRQRVG